MNKTRADAASTHAVSPVLIWGTMQLLIERVRRNQGIARTGGPRRVTFPRPVHRKPLRSCATTRRMNHAAHTTTAVTPAPFSAGVGAAGACVTGAAVTPTSRA